MGRIEGRTLAVLLGCYLTWGFGVTWLAGHSLWQAVALVTVAICLHSSLRHEAIHGHPTDNARLNAVLVFPALDLLVPWGRFRDTHLAHHRDAQLTDPYDDPESNYLDPANWAALPGWAQAVLRLNATAAGRMVLGPGIGMIAFLRADLAAVRAGVAGIASAWGWHLPGAALVVGVLALWGQMPWWAYGLAVYLSMALLKLRTFLEHRAHALSRARTAIVEDRGPLAFLFLNNNLHVVHHMHPDVAWYDLPARYRAGRARYLACNEGYVYRSYGEVLRRHLWQQKEPVAHPLYPWSDTGDAAGLPTVIAPVVSLAEAAAIARPTRPEPL